MYGTCIVAGCDKPSGPDSDECRSHLAEYEREVAASGGTPCPCREGHYGCAHSERGRCHGYQPSPDSTLCPDGRADCQF